MTNTESLGTIEATNPVLTVAPPKEDSEMNGATNKSQHSTAVFRKRMNEPGSLCPLKIRRICLCGMHGSTISRIPHFLWMMA